LRELIFDRIGRGSVCATGHCFDAFFRSELTEGHTPGITAISVSFDGRSVTYGFGELDALVPACAASIHKSQGSEYPAMVIPVMTQRHAMLQRNLLYTGVTRGKRLVVLFGQKKAIAIAVRNVSGRRRWSKLAEWLSADVVT
jgi:exodeoxyribonuclease V alpha subunit